MTYYYYNNNFFSFFSLYTHNLQVESYRCLQEGARRAERERKKKEKKKSLECDVQTTEEGGGGRERDNKCLECDVQRWGGGGEDFIFKIWIVMYRRKGRRERREEQTGM